MKCLWQGLSSRLSGFSIFLGGSTDWRQNTACATGQPAPGPPSLVATIPCVGDGRYLHVVLPGKTEYLTLCEVEISSCLMVQSAEIERSYLDFRPKIAGNATAITIIFTLKEALPAGYAVIVHLPDFEGASSDDLETQQNDCADQFICSWNDISKILTVKKQDGILSGMSAVVILAENGIKLPSVGLQESDDSLGIGILREGEPNGGDAFWADISMSPSVPKT